MAFYEALYEKKLITELRKHTNFAMHMNTDQDGFLDVFVQRGGACILIEVKDCSRGVKLDALLEETQPIFIREYCEAGGIAYLFPASSHGGTLYQVDETLIVKIMQGERPLLLSDLKPIVTGTYQEIGDWITGMLMSMGGG